MLAIAMAPLCWDPGVERMYRAKATGSGAIVGVEKHAGYAETAEIGEDEHHSLFFAWSHLTRWNGHTAE